MASASPYHSEQSPPLPQTVNKAPASRTLPASIKPDTPPPQARPTSLGNLYTGRIFTIFTSNPEGKLRGSLLNGPTLQPR